VIFENINTGCLNDEDSPWMPYAPYSDQVMVKYFKIDPVHGEVCVMMKAPPGIEMARHHHTGTVIVYTVQGAWKYKEHDWVARAGSLVYETASTAHTPESLPGTDDTIAFNVVKGELVYTDDKGNVLAVENWKTAMKRYLDYCSANGVTPKDLSSFAG
jgi:quercetin dioxygenase-like cupin family protein